MQRHDGEVCVWVYGFVYNHGVYEVIFTVVGLIVSLLMGEVFTGAVVGGSTLEMSVGHLGGAGDACEGGKGLPGRRRRVVARGASSS